MEKKPKSDDSAQNGLPLPSSTDLRGRQSVRATFKLSSRAIDALAVCAIHLGIKQKSLFDHLIDDMKALQTIAQELNPVQFGKLDRIQKTFVLSRRTLSCLDQVSQSLNAPRDALVEYSIQRLMPVIEKERKRHRKRKLLLEKMAVYLEDGERLLRQARSDLGVEDPVTRRLETVVSTCRGAVGIVSEFVDKGSVIEEF
ncbi:MAG: hypothetical protein PVG78_10870 [Desulfobacterales bacterium]|jgi:hypothetical protein